MSFNEKKTTENVTYYKPNDIIKVHVHLKIHRNQHNKLHVVKIFKKPALQ